MIQLYDHKTITFINTCSIPVAEHWHDQSAPCQN